MSGCVDRRIFFFNAFPDFLLIYYSSKDVSLGWPEHCVRITPIYYFIRFPYLLAMVLKDVRLGRTKQFFPYLNHSTQHFSGLSYLLTTFSKDARLRWPHKFFLVSWWVNLRFKIWARKWLQGGVAHSSTSQTIFLNVSAVKLVFEIWPLKWLPVKVTKSRTCPSFVSILG